MNKLEMLERAVMELGGEVYALRNTVDKSNTNLSNILQIVKGLKQLLDDKGLITVEDFDTAIDLADALEPIGSNADHHAHLELEKLKKIGH